MTRDEAIFKIKGYLTDCIPSDDYDEVEEIIEALEQAPCEDYISRQAVLDLDFDRICVTCAKPNEMIRQKIIELPVINHQKPKTGQWITFEAMQSGFKEIWYRCSICKWKNALLLPRNYCPNCGCRMESEAKK